jgi:hypothetical protein
MEKDDWIFLLVVVVGILVLTSIITFGIYKYRQLNVENFQKTINNLSEEQKCLHICGFQFDNYLENYKFCVEKCDRISERTNGDK